MRSDVSDAKSPAPTGASIKVPLRVLIVEDSEFDAQMMVSILRKGGYDVSCERVETGEGMRKALHDRAWDMILADYIFRNLMLPRRSKSCRKPDWTCPLLSFQAASGRISRFRL